MRVIGILRLFRWSVVVLVERPELALFLETLLFFGGRAGG